MSRASNSLYINGRTYTLDGLPEQVVQGDNDFTRQSLVFNIEASRMPDAGMRIAYTDYGYNNFIFLDSNTDHIDLLRTYLLNALYTPANLPFFNRPGTYFSLNGYIRTGNPFAVDEEDAAGIPPIIQVYTELRSNIQEVVYKFIQKIKRMLEIYGVEVCYLMGSITLYRYTAPEIGMGSVFRSYMRANEIWVRCVTASRTDCLYTAAATALSARNDRTILFDTKRQQQNGWNLKRRMKNKGYDVPESFATTQQIKDIADHSRIQIIVYNNIFEKTIDYTPENSVKDSIEILIAQAHFCPLIRRSRLSDAELTRITELERNEKDEQTELVAAMPQPAFMSDEMIEQMCVENSKRIRPTFCKVDANKASSTDLDGKEQTESVFSIDKVVAWDLETSRLSRTANDLSMPEDSVIHKAYAAGLAFMENGQQVYKSFWGLDCIHQFIDYIHQRYSFFQGKTFYAHNGAKFDITLLLREGILDPIYKSPLKMVGGNRAIELNGGWIHLELAPVAYVEDDDDDEEPGSRKRKRKSRIPTIVFHDSYKIMPGKLGDLTVELKVEHQKLTEVIKHDQITLANYSDPEYINNLRTYLEHDVRGLLEVVQKYGDTIQEKLNVDITKCFTAASVAKRAFWKNFFDTKCTIYHLGNAVERFIREGYYGGRVEAHFIGPVHEAVQFTGKRFFYYDFTSLYPWVATFPLPYEKPMIIQNLADTSMVVNGILQDKFFGFVRVTVSSHQTDNETRKPLHAVINNHRLLFPWLKNKRTLVLFSEEIKLSQRLKLPYKYHWDDGAVGIRFRSAPILKNMMKTCFDSKAKAKDAGQDALAMAYKITANSAYGFWGIRVQDRDSCVVYEDNHNAKEYYRYLAEQKLIGVGKHTSGNGINYMLLRVLKDLGVRDHNVAIASAITSYARCELYKCMYDIEQKGDTVLYTDTDSLITTLSLKEHPDLEQKYRWDGEGKELGTLKNEYGDKYKKRVEDELKARQLQQDGGEFFFDRCWIAGAKFYAWERSAESTIDKKSRSSTKCKGYAKGADMPGLTTADFHSLFENKPDVDKMRADLQNQKITYDEFVKLTDGKMLNQEQLQFRVGRSDFIRERDMFAIRYVKVTKRFGVNYLKGKVQETGIVKPIVL